MMNKYIALTNLMVAGKAIAIGEQVELDSADADRMSSVIELVKSKKPTAKQAKADAQAQADADAQAQTDTAAPTAAEVQAEADAKTTTNAADVQAAKNGSSQLDLVIAEIDALEVNNDNYTKGGKPDAVVLSDNLDMVVSAKLRDEAWDAYQAQNADD